MLGSYGAEAIKFTKRASTRTFGALWMVVAVLFLYVGPLAVIWYVFRDEPGAAARELNGGASVLLPESSVGFVIRYLFSTLGTAVALVLGAMAAGSEYGWGTAKMILSQKPSRASVLSGKLLLLASALALFAVAAIVGGLLASFVGTLFFGTRAELPPAGTLAGGLGAGFLLLAAWGAIGFALATLFRGSALAIGLGLIYAFALEPVLEFVMAFNETTAAILRVLPGQAVSAVTGHFATFEQGAAQGGGGGEGAAASGAPTAAPELLDPALAAVVLGLYVVVAVAVTYAVFLRRDVA